MKALIAMMRAGCRPLWIAALACLVAGPAAAQTAAAAANAIESLSAVSQPGGSIQIRVAMKEAPTNPPAAFAIDSPPRIVFDFPNTANASGRTSAEGGDQNLRSMNLVQSGDRTRLVVNLARQMGYDTRIDGKNIVITLQGAAAAAAAPVVSQFAEQKPRDTRHNVRHFDFRRSPTGAGRIEVDLSDNMVGIDLRQEGGRVVVDLLNTSVPKNLERRYDVRDFATPVQQVDVTTQGPNTRLVISPQGNWEQSAYQTDNRFIIEIKPVVEDPTKLVQGSRQGYSGEKLSLNFQNIDVRAVLQVIADFTGLNIITSDTVTGNLTLRLKDVPWDQALDIILQSKGLDHRKNGNVVWIAPREELATKEKLELEARQQIADLEPLRTETFQLNYAKAPDFVKVVSDEKQRILSRRGSAVIDPRTNSIFVQDTAARLEQIRALVRKIDVPVRQVLIESRIVEAIDQFARNLGVRLGILDRTANGDTVGSQIGGSQVRQTVGGNLDATGYLTTQVASPVPTLNQSMFVNLPAGAIAGAQPGVFSLILFNNALSRFLNLELTALQADGRGKIISSPRVITSNQQEAIIEQGEEIPYQQATSSGATAVQFKKATLSLKVKPQITPDDNIIMKLEVHKDSRGTITQSGPAIDTKQITTEVLVENGGTVVIGGIYTQDERNTVNKVPVLGDLPYIGFLFKQDIRSDDRRELLVFISPRVLTTTLGAR